MASYDSDVYKAQDPGRVNPSRLLDKDVISGSVEYAVISHTLTNESAGDTINVCLLPAGVIPVPQLSRVTFSGVMNNAFELRVGTAATPSGWFSLQNIDQPGDWGCSAPASVAQWTVATPLVADPGSDAAKIVARVTATDGPNGGAVLTFLLAYKVGR